MTTDPCTGLYIACMSFIEFEDTDIDYVLEYVRTVMPETYRKLAHLQGRDLVKALLELCAELLDKHPCR